MAVTKSRSAERRDALQAGKSGQPLVWRRQELAGMAAALVLVGIGLMLVYRSKAGDLAEVEQGLKAKTILNLNDLSAREDLLPALSVVPDPRDREEVARKIYYLRAGSAMWAASARSGFAATSFASAQTAVRGPPAGQFRDPSFAGRRSFWRVLWRARVLEPARIPRRPDPCCRRRCCFGPGLILMVSLRDPVRDNLLFADFAQGAAMGCAAAWRRSALSITST